MPTSPRSRKRNLFVFCDFFWIGDHCRKWHNVQLRVIVTTFVIATAPCVQAQTPVPSKVTKADAQKVFKIISGDKAKTRVYCQMARLGHQMEQANETGDSKKFDALFNRMYELGKKLGPCVTWKKPTEDRGEWRAEIVRNRRQQSAPSTSMDARPGSLTRRLTRAFYIPFLARPSANRWCVSHHVRTRNR